MAPATQAPTEPYNQVLVGWKGVSNGAGVRGGRHVGGSGRDSIERSPTVCKLILRLLPLRWGLHGVRVRVFSTAHPSVCPTAFTGIGIQMFYHQMYVQVRNGVMCVWWWGGKWAIGVW